jgi:large subunit ribosomal protein L10
MIGMNSSSTYTLRKELRSKKIKILVVKNSMAARAATGTPLARMFDGVSGSAAICWGSEDIVSLAKAISEIIKSEKFPTFQPRGGVMDGEQLSADQIADVAKWPSRTEQLSLLLGQICSVGGRLNSQLLAAGGALASQIAEKAKGGEEEPLADAAATPPATEPTVPAVEAVAPAAEAGGPAAEITPPPEETPAS